MDARTTFSRLSLATLMLLAAACDVSSPPATDVSQDAATADAPVVDVPAGEVPPADPGTEAAADVVPETAPDAVADPAADPAADLTPVDPGALDLPPVEVVPVDLGGDPGHGACKDDTACGAGQYCNLPGCATPGACADKPSICTKEYKPVCGCDGKTYGNACMAAAAGASVANDGECPTPGCADNKGCNTTEYCAKASCDGTGSCKPRPTECYLVYKPVCGCDGKTYGNDCEAAAAGVNVAHSGECAVAGCTDNTGCSGSAYCAKDGCDGTGTCMARPTVCVDLWAPVCGCDGKTYSNSCNAASAGVNVKYSGECLLVGCNDNGSCGKDWFCAMAACTPPGACMKRPGACPMIYDPVCGCDGKTYGNDCEAAAAGVNVAHSGECAVAGCTDNTGCSGSAYCAKDGCDGTGTCMARPTVCVDLWAPVCGCDGKTYSNSCNAASAGVNVKYSGECLLVGCNDNGSCGKDWFCAMAACTPPGVCTERPGACPMIYDPVCGCDGKTYGNACSAASAGMNVAHKGACS